jgi:hypothetical protein
VTDALVVACSREIGPALVRQQAMVTLLGDRPWQLDLGEGVARFGDDLVCPARLLGSQSHRDGSWMWGWANENIHVPPSVLAPSLALRELGHRDGIGILTWGVFDIPGGADALALAMVFGGIAGGLPVYRGPYDGGSVYFMLEDVPLPPISSTPAIALPSLLAEAVAQSLPLDHRIVTRGLFDAIGMSYVEEPGRVLATHDGVALVVAFDDQERLTGVSLDTEGADTTP